MTLKHPVLNMHNGESNGNVHMYLDKQIHMDVDTIVSFVILNRRVSRAKQFLCRIMLIVMEELLL